MREFRSFYRTVGGNEGNKCRYATRLDTYGCGCGHDCDYCYARSLLDFRKLWDPANPAVADIGKIRRCIKRIEPGTIVRLGGMTDCFQPAERVHRVTLETIRALNERGVGYLIVTKSSLVAEPEYMDAYDRDLAHFQITVTSTDDATALRYEKASPSSERIRALLRLQDAGFDAAIRLSPLIEDYIDFEQVNGLGISKAVVEFLRVNHWIRQWFDIDYSKYTLKQSGYCHLPLEEKVRILSRLAIPVVTVCEDVTGHYEYWKRHVNPDPDDCCCLRKKQ